MGRGVLNITIICITMLAGNLPSTPLMMGTLITFVPHNLFTTSQASSWNLYSFSHFRWFIKQHQLFSDKSFVHDDKKSLSWFKRTNGFIFSSLTTSEFCHFLVCVSTIAWLIKWLDRCSDKVMYIYIIYIRTNIHITIVVITTFSTVVLSDLLQGIYYWKRFFF